jgi:hypothetical protein
LRVNITYSVDLNDVPNEVSRILEECEDVFRSIHGRLDQTIGREPLIMIKQLDEIRISLAKLDLKMGDSMEILTGYVQTVSARPMAEQAEALELATAEESGSE